jgi:hypothetical protein
VKGDLLPLEQLLTDPDLPAGRDAVLRLEAEIAKLPQVEFPLRHFFAKGLYIREISIPAGHVLTGYIHTQECVTTLAKGRVLMTEGEEMKELTAPHTGSYAAGTKKAIFAIEDAVWIDSYANPDDERDLEVLHDRYTAKSHREYLTRTNLLLEKP